MAYTITSVTTRTDNSPEGMKKIMELWQDITSGKIPLLFDSEHTFQQGISPVSRYSTYESDETGLYDLSILAVHPDFFAHMEQAVATGTYRKYETADATGNTENCTREAWTRVWNDQKSGIIHRAFTEDFESTVPVTYAKDGQAHCYLYIAVR